MTEPIDIDPKNPHLSTLDPQVVVVGEPGRGDGALKLDPLAVDAPRRQATTDDRFKRLLWLDFETNGLHDKGYEVHVLEVAAVVTDADLNELAVFEPMTLKAPDEAYESMDDFVTRMHTANGLLEESKNSAILDHGADMELSAFVADWFPAKDAADKDADYQYKGAVVAGSSVGSFDLRVLSERFPLTRKLCSHRTYDISAVNEFAARAGVASVNTAASAETSDHRALSDIYASIAKARALKKALA